MSVGSLHDCVSSWFGWFESADVPPCYTSEEWDTLLELSEQLAQTLRSSGLTLESRPLQLAGIAVVRALWRGAESLRASLSESRLRGRRRTFRQCEQRTKEYLARVADPCGPEPIAEIVQLVLKAMVQTADPDEAWR